MILQALTPYTDCIPSKLLNQRPQYSLTVETGAECTWIEEYDCPQTAELSAVHCQVPHLVDKFSEDPIKDETKVELMSIAMIDVKTSS